MSIVLVGINHQTAPVELRDQLSLSGDALRMALDELSVYKPTHLNGNMAEALAQECVILSTCNRLEIYAIVANPEHGWSSIASFIGQFRNIPIESLQPHLYFKSDREAAYHLMRVACGLDSMILGESQILGQVALALNESQSSGTAGAILSHLFAQAIHSGKRARTETDISHYTTSVSHAAALLVAEKVSRVADHHVLIVGAGEMAGLAAQALKRHGAQHITFLNRTYRRAETLAKEVGGQAKSWSQLTESLTWADIVICATSAPHTIIYAADVERILPQRNNRPLLFIDIAVPRDVEDIVSDLPSVQRFDIDDLQSTVDSNIAQRKAAIPGVEIIIDQELTLFLEWLNSRQVSSIIQNLREWAQHIAAAEVQQALNRLPDADQQTEQVIQRLAHRLTNKLLHEPTVRLRSHAAEGNGHGYAYAVRELFGLDRLETVSCEKLFTTQNGKPCDLKCILPAGKA